MADGGGQDNGIPEAPPEVVPGPDDGEVRPPRRPARLSRGAGRHSAPGSRLLVPRSPAVLALLVAVAVIGAVLVVVTVTRGHPSAASPVARSYLSAWSRRDFATMATLVEHPPPDFVAVHQGVLDNLHVTRWQYRMTSLKGNGSTADAAYAADVIVAGLGSWDYPGTVHLARVFGRWMVEWTPATIFHGLPLGGHLALQRIWSPRAAVLGSGGTVLAGPSEVVTVGLQGNAISSPSEVTAALRQAGFDQAAIASALAQAAARPSQFVAVGDLPDSRYQQVKPVIFRVPGTRFQRRSGQMSVTADLAAHVVGSVGPITADQLGTLAAPYEAGDAVGQVGIESQYERQLAGTPSVTVQVLGPDGSVVGTAFATAGKAGAPVQTTIDLHVEQAAEAALNGVRLPAAFVAVRASTGEILAAVSRPDATPFDRALQGQYPPGSTFKVVTSAALLAGGLTPDSPTTCPKTLTVQGRTFNNFEGESALDISLQRAFAVSCNTAFIGLAGNLPSQALLATAAQFGFGATPQTGLAVFWGRVPPPVDEVEKVASAIGQGRVLASPLQMAGVAAAVASGAVRAPRLVAGASDDNAKAVPLAQPVAEGLRSMMAAAVASGTGAPARVPGPTVYGKTGTAEFGSATPPMTHAWFIGFRGDIAFAVVVDGGGVGGTVAAPIAARFLRGL